MGLPRRNNNRSTMHMTSNQAHEPAMNNPFSMDDNADDDLINDDGMYDDYDSEDSAADMADRVDSINDDQSFDDDQSSYLDEGSDGYDLQEPDQPMQEPVQDQAPHREMADRKTPEFIHKSPEPPQKITTKDIKPVDNAPRHGPSTAALIGLAASMASFVIFVPMLGLMLSILQGNNTPLAISGVILIILPFVGLAAGAMALSHKGEHKGPAITSIIMSIVAILTVGLMVMQIGTIQAKVIDSVNSTFAKVMESSGGSSLPSPEDSDSKYGDGVYGGSNESNNSDKSTSSGSKSSGSKSSKESKGSKSSDFDNDDVKSDVVEPDSSTKS